MSKDFNGIKDGFAVLMDRARELADGSRISGWGTVELFDATGERKLLMPFTNLVTDYGDQFYAEGGAGIGSHNAVSGMKLGTGATAAAKTGAGAALVTYLSGSNKAIDATYPQSSQPGGAGTARRITWKTTWDPGEATNAAIAEAVIVNPASLTDATSAASETISRLVFASTIDKQAGDTLALTWSHDFAGA